MLFFVLSETWLREHLDAEISIEGYDILRVDRSRPKKRRGRNSGGVAIYIKQTISGFCKTLLNFSNGVIEAICLGISSLNLILCGIYTQPDDPLGGNWSTSEEYDALLAELNTVIEAQPAATPNIIISGDFNLPHTIWPACAPSCGASSQEQKMINLTANFMARHFMTQIVNELTHRAGNILDIILTNNPEMFSSVTTLPASQISSNYLVTAQTLLSLPNVLPNYIPEDTNKFDQCKLFSDKTNWEKIKESFQHTNWNILFQNCTVTEMMVKFLQKCQDIAVVNYPGRSRTKFFDQRRIPRDRRILMRKRTKLRKRFQEAKSEQQKNKLHSDLVAIEGQLQASYQNELKEEERKAVEAIKTNSKFFYSYARRHNITQTMIGHCGQQGDGKYPLKSIRSCFQHSNWTRA